MDFEDQPLDRLCSERWQIPLPPLTTQQAIVAEIESEQALVNANRELIARFEKKIQGVIDRVWEASTSGQPGSPSP